MELNEQTNNWVDTNKVDYIKKKKDSSNFDVQIIKKDGKDVYQYRKKTQSTSDPKPLPSWTPDCLKNTWGDKLKPTSPPSQVYLVVESSKWYFEEPKNNKNRFIYIDGTTKVYGTWECQSDGSVLIKADDGTQYSSKDKKWVDQPSNTVQTQTKPKGNPLKPEDYSGIEFVYKYPNDKNYIYGVKDNDWYAKNINNRKVFNISKDEFQYSVDELNKKFPDAFNVVKDENKLESNVQVRPKGNQFTDMKKEFEPINFTPKYQTKTDSLTTDKNVLNKQQEPTIYNIDSNKNEL